MYCRFCGARLNEKASYCLQCGKPIPRGMGEAIMSEDTSTAAETFRPSDPYSQRPSTSYGPLPPPGGAQTPFASPSSHRPLVPPPPPYTRTSPPITRQGLSRRTLLTGLAALTLVGGGGTLGWSIIHHQTASTLKSLAALKPAPTATPKPLVLSPALEMAFSTNASKNFLATISSTDGVTWPGSTQVQSHIQLQGSPALATLNKKRYMAFVGNNTNNMLYLASFDGQNWSIDRAMAMHTQENPTMVAFKNTLYMAFTANDGSNLLYITTSTDGEHWSVASSPNSMHLQGSPTLAVFNQTLYVAFRSSDVNSSLCIASSVDGQNWSAVTEYVNTLLMAGSPTMAQFNNKLYIAFRSYYSDNSLYVTSSTDGHNWPHASTFGQSLQGNPSMTAFGDRLYIAYQANNTSNSLYVTSSADGQTWSVDKQFTVTAQDNPAIVAF